MFTTGASDRNGFRLGAGTGISYTSGDWTIDIGADTYKTKEHFGIGTTYAGFCFFDGNYGSSYYVNHYYQGDKQTSAIIAVRAKDFRIRFEDDILALPFTKFIIQDRFRTAALELRYKGFIIGTNVYTSDPNGLTVASLQNRNGVHYNTRQISSPIYVGYTSRNIIGRIGYNNQTGGFIGQNMWHRNLFSTADFKYGRYSNPFIQIGINKPYTLY